jgi:outer membrane immunogenic protein
MKQVLLGCAAALWACAAVAADFPAQPAVVPPPVPPAPFSWTGGYVGLNAGWGFGKIDTSATFFGGTLNGATATGSANPSGALVGGQVGYDYQWGMFVVGGEVDLDFSGQTGSLSMSCGVGCTISGSPKINGFAMLRVQAGVALDNLMIYAILGSTGLGGPQDLKLTTGGSTNPVTLSKTKGGGTLGAGVEWAMTRNWSFRAEYLYFSSISNDLSTTHTLPKSLGGNVADSTKVTDSLVLFGFNYRF